MTVLAQLRFHLSHKEQFTAHFQDCKETMKHITLNNSTNPHQLFAHLKYQLLFRILVIYFWSDQSVHAAFSHSRQNVVATINGIISLSPAIVTFALGS